MTPFVHDAYDGEERDEEVQDADEGDDDDDEEDELQSLLLLNQSNANANSLTTENEQTTNIIAAILRLQQFQTSLPLSPSSPSSSATTVPSSSEGFYQHQRQQLSQSSKHQHRQQQASVEHYNDYIPTELFTVTPASLIPTIEAATVSLIGIPTIDNRERLVLTVNDIIANDERLNREVDALFPTTIRTSPP
jgi:hypothetical protein